MVAVSGGHRHRLNLILHILSVPFFLAGTIGLVIGAVTLNAWLGGASVVVLALVVVVQGRGHALEETPSVPFLGLMAFVIRFSFEQWVTFPRYVLSGTWARTLRDRR